MYSSIDLIRWILVDQRRSTVSESHGETPDLAQGFVCADHEPKRIWRIWRDPRREIPWENYLRISFTPRKIPWENPENSWKILRKSEKNVKIIIKYKISENSVISKTYGDI